MSSRRKLKKEIDEISMMIIIDSLSCLSVDKNKEKSEEIIDILNDSIQLRDELIARISHVDAKEDHKKVRAFFNAIKTDFRNGVEANFVKLSNIIKG